jgi:cobalt-zinc-cadmium efflux system outer membrane protein
VIKASIHLNINLYVILAVALIVPVAASAAPPAMAATDALDQAGGKPDTTVNSPGPTDRLQVFASQEVYPRRRLGLKESFDKANNYNKEILVSEASLPIAQAGITIAGAIPNPIFNSTYGFGPAWEYIAAGNNQQVGWSEELQVLGKRTKKIAVAKAQRGQAQLQIQAVRFSVHNRLRRAYAELAAAAAYSDLVEDQRLVAVKLVDIATKRYDAGKAPGSEVLQAKLAVLQFDTLRNLAKGRLVQDSAQLSQLLGETPYHQEIINADVNSLFALSAANTVVVPGVSRGVPALENLLPAAWNERKDLKVAIQQAYVDYRAHGLAKTFWLPDPSVGFNFLYSTYKKLQPLYIPYNAPFQPGFQLEVSHETPIFYHYQGERNQAKATWLQQLKQTDLLTSQIAASAVSSYEELVTTIENIKKFQDKLLPAASQVAQLSRRSYQLGKSDLATAMLAQQQYQQVRSNYFDAVVAYQNAWADLETAVGVPLKI